MVAPSGQGLIVEHDASPTREQLDALYQRARDVRGVSQGLRRLGRERHQRTWDELQLARRLERRIIDGSPPSAFREILGPVDTPA